jgi:uncharacterized protein YfiM (DUF2279 family)
MIKNLAFLLLVVLTFSVNSLGVTNSRILVEEQPNLLIKQSDCKFKITLKDRWFSKDKADHLLASAFLTAHGYYLLKKNHQNAVIVCTSVTFSLGVSKEIRDGFRPDNAASIKDMTANLVGIFIGTLLFNRK